MDKRILVRIDDEEKRLAISKVIDTVNLASKHFEAKFTNFLDASVTFYAKNNMYFDPDVKVMYWGGYEGSERQVFCAVPEWESVESSDFPIKCIRAVSSNFNKLTHRDYLGALMGLGIVREQIGDIVVDDKQAFIFCKSDIFSYIMNNLDKVGRDGITLSEADGLDEILLKKEVQQISISVSSMRLDSILSGALNISRNTSAQLIKSCKVKVNFDECENLSKILSYGDLISVRGFGRLKIGDIGGQSRKGRTYIQIEKYL